MPEEPHDHDDSTMQTLTGQITEELQHTTDPVRARELRAKLDELDEVFERLSASAKARRPQKSADFVR